jgi:hypothetical protein
VAFLITYRTFAEVELVGQHPEAVSPRVLLTDAIREQVERVFAGELPELVIDRGTSRYRYPRHAIACVSEHDVPDMSKARVDLLQDAEGGLYLADPDTYTLGGGGKAYRLRQADPEHPGQFAEVWGLLEGEHGLDDFTEGEPVRPGALLHVASYRHTAGVVLGAAFGGIKPEAEAYLGEKDLARLREQYGE